MRIENSAVSMMGKFNSTKKSEGKDFLSYLTSNYSPGFNTAFQIEQTKSISTGNMKSSSAVKTLSAQSKTIKSSTKDTDFIIVEAGRMSRRRMLVTQQLIQALTGKKVKFRNTDSAAPNADFIRLIIPNSNDASGEPASSLALGIEYSDVQYERQEMSFKSDGTITTEDGRKIDFSLKLDLSKESVTETDISIVPDQQFVDPLVINFDNSTAGLTNTKFAFDIDTNGSPEQVSFVTQGSGLLALDLNGDGKINSGVELFGPKSGDGFTDLSSYDADGNNWIDENDPIYDKLRLWTKDQEGNDNLFSLGAKGVGAIYLGNVNTSYDISDSFDGTQGVLKKTGLFVREDGTVGTVQDIDMTA